MLQCCSLTIYKYKERSERPSSMTCQQPASFGIGAPSSPGNGKDIADFADILSHASGERIFYAKTAQFTDRYQISARRPGTRPVDRSDRAGVNPHQNLQSTGLRR